MKIIKLTIILLFALLGMGSAAAQDNAKARAFEGRVYNEEFKVFIVMNAYDQDIVVPGQEIFGEMAGYFRSDDDARCWLITSMKVAENGSSAKLSFTNDYGSEDLTATLTIRKDGTYELKQIEGSTLKIARKNKWVKMPKTLTFKKS